MATFWCPNCETTFQQDALSEQGIACPHCHTDLHPVVKVADISALRGQPHEPLEVAPEVQPVAPGIVPAVGPRAHGRVAKTERSKEEGRQ
jgi:hypothetical protein